MKRVLEAGRYVRDPVTEEAGAEDAVKLIAGVLEREARAERLALDAPIVAAQL